MKIAKKRYRDTHISSRKAKCKLIDCKCVNVTYPVLFPHCRMFVYACVFVFWFSLDLLEKKKRDGVKKNPCQRRVDLELT